MPFSRDDYWVWDFWFADDGDRFHLYYLHAPRALGDPNARHRNARVGHAVSPDLRTWTDLGECLAPSGGTAIDADATWTGSVVRDADGGWRMFYTGSRFLTPMGVANIETVAVATSHDLHTWVKHPEQALSADPLLYETLGATSWREEAWRDPWVMPAPRGHGWWMLVTARSSRGADELDRGVIGLATSDDLTSWQVQASLSEPGAGFCHLEVPQLIEVDGHRAVIFSCDTPALAGARVERGERGGIWVVEVDDALSCIDASTAKLLLDDSYYAARVVVDRDGQPQLLAFRNTTIDTEFTGGITDPMPLRWSATTGIIVEQTAEVLS